MQQAAEIFAVIYLSGIGLSHALQPQVWVEFFAWMREKGRAGMFVEGLLSLGFGALVVAFHNVWSGLPVVLTLIGWGQVPDTLPALTLPAAQAYHQPRAD